MKYNYEFDMKYTDNPYIDIIVQCVKILGMNAVVKNENQALHYEDVRSAKLSNDYIKWKEGYWDENKDGPYYEERYMEWNSYYRMLYGLPPAYTLADEKAYLDATGYGDEIYEDIGNAYVIPDLYKRYFIDMGQYTVPDEMKDVLDLQGKYLHELNMEELAMVESCGIMQEILDQYSDDPHYQYIYHLGDKRVDYYTARKAVNFSLIWVPELDTFDIIEEKFKRIFDRNRKYTMATVYSEAYRFMSYHYDAFIEILIIIQTMVDMISEVQEYIINKDVFDSRTIRYLFESYGIAYYKEIPVKYQIRIIKNVNELLKYKSSNRNIMDILELFDDDSINIYTYYLMKIKKIPRDDFFYYTEDDVNPKYNTNRDYWIGDRSAITNNRVPLTRTIFNASEPEFIKKYLYMYDLVNPKLPDQYYNRLLTANNQPVTGVIVKPYESSVHLAPANSFIDSYLRDSKVNWFDVYEYNYDIPSQQKWYVQKRSIFISGLAESYAKRIGRYFMILIQNTYGLSLNQYYYRRLKYALFDFLGIFNGTDILSSPDFDNMTDEELASRFYEANDLVTDEYRVSHGLSPSDYDENSNDRFILNHTIPYLCYFPYKESEEIEDYDNNDKSYIFNNNNSFNVNPTTKPDDYDKWTKLFRESYIVYIRSYEEGLWADLNPTENNPYPQYIGWMDLNYVLTQLNMTVSELRIGDKVTTINHPNIPIYNEPYVSKVITEEMVGQEYFNKNYELSFLKVPILEPNAYEYLDRFDLRRGYDAITLEDPFWDGVSNFDILTEDDRAAIHEDRKDEILSKDFSIERTKYIGVEAAIDLTKMSRQMSYFLNMLYDKHKDEEKLYVEVPRELCSAGKVRLNDLLTFATALNYLYQGIEPDTIATDMENNMEINGFNFDTDWVDIYNYLQNHHAIYNHYSADEPSMSYTYTDEFGILHEVIDGYGMDPLYEGYKSELYNDFIIHGQVFNIETGEMIDVKTFRGFPSEELDPVTERPVNEREYADPVTHIPEEDTKVGAFLSGRYE